MVLESVGLENKIFHIPQYKREIEMINYCLLMVTLCCAGDMYDLHKQKGRLLSEKLMHAKT